MGRRRVVTGHDREGRSVFLSDEMVEPVTVSLMPGAEFHRMWGRDEPADPPGDTAAAGERYFPPVGGFRFGFFTLPPASVTTPTDIELGAALEELDARLPGMTEVMEPENPGMHTTRTIDFEVVVSGEVWLELDDGAETRLGPGDCLVQNGTRHAWHNKTDQPVTLAVAIVGTR